MPRRGDGAPRTRSRASTPPHRRRSPAPRSSRFPRPNATGHGSFFELTCGAEAAAVEIDPTSPYPLIAPAQYAVPILPLPLELPAFDTGAAPARTGCGARIHTGASPGGSRTWLGVADGAGSTLVALPAEYFTAAQQTRLGGVPRRDACGCVAVGVGCCLCGNVLGLRTTPCAAHVISLFPYTFLAEAVYPPLPRWRKTPIIIDRERTVDDQFDLAGWLSQSYERRRAQSPSQSEIDPESDLLLLDSDRPQSMRSAIAPTTYEALHA